MKSTIICQSTINSILIFAMPKHPFLEEASAIWILPSSGLKDWIQHSTISRELTSWFRTIHVVLVTKTFFISCNFSIISSPTFSKDMITDPPRITRGTANHIHQRIIYRTLNLKSRSSLVHMIQSVVQMMLTGSRKRWIHSFHRNTHSNTCLSWSPKTWPGSKSTPSQPSTIKMTDATSGLKTARVWYATENVKINDFKMW